MSTLVETQRLLLREMDHVDAPAMFELDSDPDVHKYLGNKPVHNLEQVHAVIDFIRLQYQENGIGRWAVIEKSSNEFVGWCGLKYHREPLNGHVQIYELGYRFLQRHWNKGFATESSLACITYGFNVLKQDVLYAMTDVNNMGSKHVLTKCGFHYVETFLYDDTDPHDWFELRKP